MPKTRRILSLSALVPALVVLVSSSVTAVAQAGPEVARTHGDAPDPAAPADSLSRQLARADSLLFDALFARCDGDGAVALLTADAEFYDDRTGLSTGEDLRGDFRRIAAHCPGDHGVRRVLLPASVEVHPIPGFGAIHTGEHHFVEHGAATTTVGRFYNTWKRTGGEWKLARIVSLHETMDAELAAEARR